MRSKESRKAAALRYNQAQDGAPRLVAKGHGKIAEKIIELAKQHRVPMIEDRNLVQMLDALDLDTQIPPELYQAVAEVLVFIYRMNGRLNR
jgi:flagellar biosynthesis protein